MPSDSKKNRKDLRKARRKIGKLDEKIFRLIAKRLVLAQKIGACKTRLGIEIRDCHVEEEVLTRNNDAAAELGLPSALAEELTQLLIKYSVQAQDLSK